MTGSYDQPPYRPLKIFAFDPTRGRTLGNYLTINTRYEDLEPGPVGKYLKVIDYDASNQCYYRPVDLDDPNVLIRGGLDPSESDPRFHQQMVYAVASETIKRFEYALGRSIHWSFARYKPDPKMKRLRIFPHAMQEANAYYSPDLGALVFGYFPASEVNVGANLPGQTVFTCLSHDIIAHETTHALVDSQKGHFIELTSPDGPAFHEAFADIVALFQHFSFKEALLEMIQRTGGQIYRMQVEPESRPDTNGPVIQEELSSDNPMVGLAQQFGEAMGMRRALRQALGTLPNSQDINTVSEPHARGSILVAAVFDAFFSIYVQRTRDLMRIARAGGMQTSDDLHPDLAKRLAAEAAKTAQHFFNICVRALDYCPPVDILFGDFLRAMITADHDLVPDDPSGYRAAIIQAFRSRGIVPEAVNSYSEESLLWCPPEVTHGEPLHCEGLEFDVFKYSDTDTGKDEKRRQQDGNNARALHQFATKNAESLGLSSEVKIRVSAFHPVHRVGPDGKLNFDVVAELTQKREVPVIPDDLTSPKFTFRGGTTLILNRLGDVRYAIQKSIGDVKDDADNRRLQRQRDYFAQLQANLGFAAYDGNPVKPGEKLNFNLIHRGY